MNRELLETLVGSNVELSGGKLAKVTLSKLQREAQHDLSLISSLPRTTVTKLFIAVEVMCKYKNNGAYSYIRDDLDRLLSKEEQDMLSQLLKTQKTTPSVYAKQMSENVFAIRSKEKTVMLEAIKYFLFRHPQLENMFHKVLTASELKTVAG